MQQLKSPGGGSGKGLSPILNLKDMTTEIKVGDHIRIIHLKGEDSTYDGKEGIVRSIDSIGQLHGTWGGLAVIPEEDDVEICLISTNIQK